MPTAPDLNLLERVYGRLNVNEFQTAESIFLAEHFAVNKAIDFALSTTLDRIIFFQIYYYKTIKSLETNKMNY